MIILGVIQFIPGPGVDPRTPEVNHVSVVVPCGAP